MLSGSVGVIAFEKLLARNSGQVHHVCGREKGLGWIVCACVAVSTIEIDVTVTAAASVCLPLSPF